MFPKTRPLWKQTPISRALLSICFGVSSKGALPPGSLYRAPIEPSFIHLSKSLVNELSFQVQQRGPSGESCPSIEPLLLVIWISICRQSQWYCRSFRHTDTIQKVVFVTFTAVTTRRFQFSKSWRYLKDCSNCSRAIVFTNISLSLEGFLDVDRTNLELFADLHLILAQRWTSELAPI
jgi:hypothetical protein